MKFFAALSLFVAYASASSLSGRILDGVNAPMGSAPYHAHLHLRATEASPTTNVGSGTLISPQHILTSATNIQNFGWWNVGLGSRNRSELQWYPSTRAVAHPQFNPSTLENNVGIIFLSSAIDSDSNSAFPATLPNNGQTSRPMTNENGRAAGFGYTMATGAFATDLQMSFQRVIEMSECLNAYQQIFTYSEHVFCGDSTQGNICAGDQGTGFVIDIQFQPVLLGVASFTAPDCRTGAPAVYTRVNQHRDWIREQMGIQW